MKTFRHHRQPTGAGISPLTSALSTDCVSRARFLLFALLLLLGLPGRAENVRIYFPARTNTGVLLTNTVKVTPISGNVLSSGGVIPIGIPFNLTFPASGVVTQSLASGYYSLTNSLLGNSGIVLRIYSDTAGDVVDYTNRLWSGYNTFVTAVVNTNDTSGGSGSATNVFFLGSSNVTWTTTGGSNVATVTGQVPLATKAISATNFANGMPLAAAVTNGYSPTFDLVGELREGYDLSFTNQNRIGLILNTTGTANRSGMTDELRQGGLLFDWDINRPFLYGGSGPGWLQLMTDADMSTSHVAVAVMATNIVPNANATNLTLYSPTGIRFFETFDEGLLVGAPGLTPTIKADAGDFLLSAETVDDSVLFLGIMRGNASGLTNGDAALIASGTLANARLDSDLGAIGNLATPSGNVVLTNNSSGQWGYFPTASLGGGSGDVTQSGQNNFSGSNYFGGNTRFAGTLRITGNLTNDTLTAGSLVKADSGKALMAAVAGTDYLSPSGSGASLTGLTASQIGPSGAVSNGQSSVTFTTINGTTLNLTTVNATNFYVWNGAGTFYSTLATSATANRTATLQDGTGTIAWLTDVQNSTNAASLPSTVNATNVTNLKAMLAASSNNWNGSFTGNAAGLTNQVYPINTITLFNTNAAMLTNCESYLVMTNNILFTNWATVAVAGQWGGVWITNSTATDYILHIPTNSMSGNLTNSIGCFVQLGLGNTNWACTISNRQTAELRWRSVGASLGATHTYVRHW